MENTLITGLFGTIDGVKPRNLRRATSIASHAPLAIATDGSVLLNAIAFTAKDEPNAILAAALTLKRPVFVGVALTMEETHEALPLIDDAAAEIAARVGPKPPRTNR